MLRNYLFVTWKVLMRRKFFTFVSLFGTSFTLLVLTIAAAFIDHSFSHMAPESKFDRVVYTSNSQLSGKTSNWRSSLGYQAIWTYYLPLADQMPDAIETITVFDNPSVNSTFHKGQKINYSLRHTDGHYFKVMDFDFLEGGAFTHEDEENGRFVAVINQSVKRQFFGDGAAVGKELVHEGRRFMVVGVVANVSELRKVAFADIWVPLSTNKSPMLKHMPSRNSDLIGNFNFAVLATDQAFLPGIKKAVSDVSKSVVIPEDQLFDSFKTAVRTHFEHFASDSIVADWETYYEKEFTGPLIVFFLLAVLVFMLLPALNLINLNLSRMMERVSEIGVRRAFGAPISSLLQQFIVENILMSLIGGLIGFLFSVFALIALNNLALFAYADFTLNYRVFAVGLILSALFGLLSGVYPAWRMAKLNPVSALKGSPH